MPLQATYYDFDGNLWTQIHQTLSEHLPFENVGYHPQRLPLPEINVRFRPYTEDLFISPRDSLSRHQPYHMHMFLFACDSIQTLKSRYRSIIGKWLGTIHSRKNQRALIVVMQKRIIVNSVQGVITASKDFTVAEFLAETLRGTSSEIGDPTAMERTSLISLNGLDTLDQMPIDCAYLIEKIKSILHDSFWSTFDTISTEVQGLERTMELPGWNYCQFFITKEALALCYQSVGLLKEAVEIYDALIATFKSRGSIIDYSIYSTLLSADEGLKGAQTGSVSTELIIKSDKFLTIDSKSDNHDEFFSSSSQKIEKYTTEGDSDRSVLGESLGLIESKAGGHLDFEKKSSQTTCGFEMFNILEMHADKSVRERILKNVVGENELFAYVFSCQAKILGDAMNFGEVLDRTRFFLNDHLEAVSHSNLVDYNSMSDACVTGSSGGNDRLSRKTGIHCWVLHTGVAIIDRCNQGRSHDSSSLLMSLTLLLLHLKASVDSVLTQYGQISGEIVSSKLGFEDPIGSISPGELIPQYLVDFVVSKTYLSIADFYSIREAISEAILRTLDRNRGPLGRRLLVSVKLDFASFYMRFNKFSSALVLYDDLVHFFKQGNMDDLWNSFAASVMCGRGDCTLALGNREVALEGYMEAWRQAVIGHHNFNIGKKICSQVKRLCRFLNGKKVELNSIDQYFGVTFNFLESAINESISINSVTITAKIPGTLVDENMIDEVHLTMLSDHSEISFSSKDRDIKVVGFPEFDQCDLSKSVDGVSKWSFKLITEEYVCTDDVYRVGRLSIHIGDIIFKQDYLPVYKMHPVRFSQSSQPVSLTVSQGQIEYGNQQCVIVRVETLERFQVREGKIRFFYNQQEVQVCFDSQKNLWRLEGKYFHPEEKPISIEGGGICVVETPAIGVNTVAILILRLTRLVPRYETIVRAEGRFKVYGSQDESDRLCIARASVVLKPPFSDCMLKKGSYDNYRFFTVQGSIWRKLSISTRRSNDTGEFPTIKACIVGDEQGKEVFQKIYDQPFVPVGLMQLLLRDTVCGHWLTVQSHVDYTFSLEKGNYNSFGSVLVYLPDRRSPYKLFESIAMTIAVSADDETHGDHQYELHADGRFWMVQGVTRGVLGFDISERKHLLQFCLVPLKSGCLSLPVFRMGNGDSGWQFNVKICDVKIDGAPVRAKTFVIPKK